MFSSGDELTVCGVVDGQRGLWFFRKRYPTLAIYKGIPRPVKVEQQKEYYTALANSPEFEFGFEWGSRYITDAQHRLWLIKPQRLIPTPQSVVSVREFFYKSARGLFILDIQGNIFQGYYNWREPDQNKCGYQGKWNQIANLPPVRSWGEVSNDLFLISADYHVWSLNKSAPIEGFPFEVRDIGFECRSAAIVLLLLSGEVVEATLWKGDYVFKTLTLPAIKSIEVGNNHVLAIDESGELWAWGKLPSQTLTPDQGDLSDPVKIPGPTGLIRCMTGCPVSFAFSEQSLWVLGEHKVDTKVWGLYSSVETLFNKSIRSITIPFNPAWQKIQPNV